MTCSVVVCAYTLDRWHDLEAVVAALEAQTRPPDELVLVVDHNPDLYERARRAFPQARVVENSAARGLSGARNTGVAAVGGDVIVFVDDDARPEADCLERLLAPYADPTVLGVGGAALPVWPGPRPQWFPAEFDWVVGCHYEGLPTSRAEVRNLLGAVMSLRRSAFATAGEFREGIGRVGRVPSGCEETELCIRLRQARPDARLLYEPAAVVRHRVSDDRVRWRYFLARCLAEGRSKALVASYVGSADGLRAERAHTLRVLPRGVARGLGETLRGRPSGLARAAAIVAGLAAATVGYAAGRLNPRAF